MGYTMWKLANLVGAAAASKLVHDYQWQAWKQEHNRVYAPAEEAKKYETFVENRKFVDGHNARYHKDLETYHVKLNKFADLTNEEFSERYLDSSLGREADNYECPEEFRFVKRDDEKYPSAITYAGILIDTYTGGYPRVTPVKDQGDSCSSSSWAFATAGAIEGTLCGQQYQDCTTWNGVSTQQQLDCCENSNQCAGGYPSNGMKCVIDNGGIDSSDDYPYTGVPSSCAYQSNLAVQPTITTCGRTMPGNETVMHQMLYQEGPATVRINASGIGFQFYFGGVYVSNLCSARPEDANHAMVATGYGNWPMTYQVEFWECKNSFGTGWGVDGYIFFKRNHEFRGGNMCGIANDVSYAVISDDN